MLRALLENGPFQPTYPVVSASYSLKMYWSRPYLAGIDTVIVNGISVVRAGDVQRVLPGRVLTRGS
tara:strand:+ start:235 stop:432 length:198 start_codon:yes stop_codon:yes gene_type:complete